VKNGLFDRFPCDSVYALHNWPDLPVGVAATRAGAIMAAADRFDIVVRGKGAHAAMPHQTPDAVLAAAELVTQLHTIVSRRVPPTENAVLSVTRLSGGQSHNVLPSAVELTGTVRTFDPKVQDTIERAVRDIAAGVAQGTGTNIEVNYVRYYPATVNSEAQAHCALEAARHAGLQACVATAPAFTSEDFAFMLQQRPGAYLWLGQAGKTDSVPLHHPSYDFNDDALAGGVRWFVAVARLALGGARDAK
jgi:amidohydrolase